MSFTRTLVILTFAALTGSIIGCKTSPNAKPVENHGNVMQNSPHPAASSTPDDGTAESAATSDTRPIVLCFGDSLTAGYGTEPGESYPDFLQQDLDEANYHYRVVNQGISGDTTKDALARVQDAIKLRPAVILVEIGGNDGLRGVPISSTRTNFDQILASLKPTGAKIVLVGITLPPQYGPDYIKQFDETYKLMAQKYSLPLLPFLYKGVFGVNGSIQQDGIHATAQGNRQVAKNVLPYVTPLLRK